MAIIGTTHAESFGLLPDTGSDVTALFRSFIHEGLGNKAHTFVFKQGVYEFKDERSVNDLEALLRGEGNWDLGENTEQKNILLHGEGLELIVLDFQGATLRFHGLIQPFSFKGCKEVSIRNVKIDWVRPLFSQGEITAVDEDGLTIQFDPEYPVQSGTPIAAMLDYIPGDAHPIRGEIDWFHFADPAVLTGPQQLYIPYKEQKRAHLLERKAFPKLGSHVIIRHIMNYKAAFLFYQCNRVVLEAVTIYTAPGMGVIGHGCGDFEIRRLCIIRRPGSGRVMSTNTDATHFIGCWGSIDFDECFFEGMGDDATNVHGFYLSVQSVVNKHSLVCGINVDIQSEYAEVPEPSDKLELTCGQTLKPYATLTVEKVHIAASGAIEIDFKEELPDRFVHEDLLANISRMASLRFRNSLVRNNRARAILVQTRNVEISDNTFDHCTGTAIHVNCADGWKESASTKDVRVTRNVFYSCGQAAGTYREASALALMTESKEAEVGVHQAFSFTDNLVYGNGAKGVSLDVLSGGELRGNRYNNVDEAVHVYADRCEHLIIE